MGGTPAGWYPDPSGAPRQRYYDGGIWTEQYAPLAAAVPPPKKSPAGKIVLGILGLIIAIVFLSNLGGKDHSDEASSSPGSTTHRPTTSSPPTYSARDYQEAAIDTCQKAVVKNLKDPDSAKFGDDWKAWKITTPNSTPPAGMTYNPAAGDQYFNAAGSVNAKNSFGGYVGDEPYYCDVVINSAGDVRARPHDATELLPTATP